MNQVQKLPKHFSEIKEKKKTRVVYYLNLSCINMLKSNK